MNYKLKFKKLSSNMIVVALFGYMSFTSGQGFGGRPVAPYEQTSELVPMSEYHNETTHFRVLDCQQCFKA